MLQHVFAVMNELLDEIMISYPNAQEAKQKEMQEQMKILQTMSDTIIDGWLQVEEKLAFLRQSSKDEDTIAAGGTAEVSKEPAAVPPDAAAEWLPALCAKQPCLSHETVTEEAGRSLNIGQGYFKLYMFKEAVTHFRRTVRICPDSVTARLFLAMSHMHLEEWEEAEQLFQLIVKWTSHPKWKALGYNALGCIQAVRANIEQAEAYFRLAYDADPSFSGAASNLNSCKKNTGKLSLYFGSAELSCM
ncbi:hypothetical protein DNH61_23405 [Paenibacillus sambharensis]|uniref:Uncharacterized protein n=1 Tax=Paenibacillus sambharensis TaxID=1803190 RepID=A0A2W1L0W8_9BACL|nr:hypothetical protein [Paenibacillus sambharensis]PZD93568.1 hypothetical protein DNH61_23405 [Paenibacillus sambharensis]